MTTKKTNPYEPEFMEMYEGDRSVGIWPMKAERVRDELLKEAKTDQDRAYINSLYLKVKEQEAKRNKEEAMAYEELNKEARV